MSRGWLSRRVAAIGACILAAAVTAAPAGAATLSFEGGPVTPFVANAGGPLVPYPSTAAAAGLSQPLGKVRVTLHALSHYYLEDLDVLLVGPGGQRAMLLSDVCPGGGGLNVTGDYTLDDDAAASAPSLGPCSGGSFKPTDYEAGEVLPGAAPAGPYPASLAGFKGTPGNGTWRLYVADDTTLTDGSTAGWTLELTEQAPPAEPAKRAKKCKKKGKKKGKRSAAAAKKKKCKKEKKK